MIINSTERIKCEHCATTHAAQVISRRAPERRSSRPFWYIHWDLFDFPSGYDGSNWLLVIKDEYSGKLSGFLLRSKSLIEILGSIRAFEQWVRRQYGLSICKIKHDNDTSMIAINRETEYEYWAQEEGIELELIPINTH